MNHGIFGIIGGGLAGSSGMASALNQSARFNQQMLDAARQNARKNEFYAREMLAMDTRSIVEKSRMIGQSDRLRKVQKRYALIERVSRRLAEDQITDWRKWLSYGGIRRQICLRAMERIGVDLDIPGDR